MAEPVPVEPEPAEPEPGGAALVADAGRRAVADRPDGGPAPRPRPRRAAPALPPGAAAPGPDGAPPGPEYTIKGNAGSKLFHGPSSPYYGRTKAEFWFRTAEDARAAGFTEWVPKRRGPR